MTWAQITNLYMVIKKGAISLSWKQLQQKSAGGKNLNKNMWMTIGNCLRTDVQKATIKRQDYMDNISSLAEGQV